jgi:opacity protein-like surface antigen
MAMDRLGRIFGYAAVALGGITVIPSAFAADLPVKAPPASITQTTAVNWTGLYFGGDIGGLFIDGHHLQPGTGIADDSIGAIVSRPTYGVYGGLNYQFLPWAVAAIEYDYIKFSEANYREFGSGRDFLDAAQHVDSISGRLGFLLMPDTLIYGKVGAAWMRVQSFNALAPGTFDKTLPGIQTGVGVESLVTPNIALRAELSYTYADQFLTIPNSPDVYRPGFLMFQVGAAFKLDPPASWGLGSPASIAVFSPQPAVAPKAPIMATKAAPPAPASTDSVAYTPNWTGFEAGGFVSGNGNQATFNDSVLGESGPFAEFAFGGGWFVGANYQYQRIVVGAEVSGNYESAKFNNPGATPNPDFGKTDRILAVTGRVGWLATADTLFYVKGGPASLRFTPNADYFNAIVPNTTPAATMAGYQAGIGAETYVMRNVSVRVEGLYTHTGHQIILQGLVPNEFTLRPSVVSAIIGLALHI